MGITQEQHLTEALMLLRGAAEHLHMLDGESGHGGEPYRDVATALADAVEEHFAAHTEESG